MILSSQTIKSLVTSDNLIDPFDEENLRASSYDLTVGDEYYLGLTGSTNKISTERLQPKQAFVIPPHGMCFILSTERIRLSETVSAKVSLRMTHIYEGLVLTAQPPFDPRYHGKVIVMVHNLSSTPVHMKSGERLATIEFFKVDQLPAYKKKHREVINLQDQLTKPISSSLAEISQKSEAVRTRVDWMVGQMLTFLALIVAVLAVPGLLSFNSLSEQIKSQNEQIEKLKMEMENLRGREMKPAARPTK